MIRAAETPAVAIVLASGAGERFRSETPKQFLKLAGRRVLEHTLQAFEQHPRIGEVVLVVTPAYRDLAMELVRQAGFRKVVKVVNGGSSRQESSASGVAAVVDDATRVLVHDAVRPLLDAATIDRCLDALQAFDAVDTGIPSPDTVIRVDAQGCIAEIPERGMLRLGQTPQGFRAGLLRRAHALAAAEPALKVTDDCGLILHYRLAAVKVVEGDVSNIKITYPSDIYLADRLFQLRARRFRKQDAVAGLGGKVLVVFGGSRGIGQRVATLARDAGAVVVAVSRADGVDVADGAAVGRVLDAAVAAHGRIDGVVNTAGVLRTGLLAGQQAEVVEEQIRTNVLGSVVVAREAFERMKGGGGGIVLFASSSYTRGRAFSAVYSATKAAVVNLMQGLAQEYLPFGVRVNALNPERTATPMRSENFGNEPLAELLDVDTVAEATLAALVSDASGEVFDVRR
ncbi:2-C-methyl-D-erythritol 4-phosphate cytidylyltransferase [Stenotrophomonas mori]|uniref:2-C-methyl-D-erythritol 4-phosphate cytidylyltransferase n=1 Tax=Stenotrophomonas mori TaxID=2871096 RepID=A0ABT0SCZ1_9GAMM|nr:2-C-methyl-D-erythritol 4-phosphate cytidylyltransferase [Stenotrophomonas mori]MCL7713178.1 2-C-methyl-D-erythritol 4-phosphate cytidylyltransferase [Stenotrophomonas mori]